MEISSSPRVDWFVSVSWDPKQLPTRSRKCLDHFDEFQKMSPCVGALTLARGKRAAGAKILRFWGPKWWFYKGKRTNRGPNSQKKRNNITPNAKIREILGNNITPKSRFWLISTLKVSRPEYTRSSKRNRFVFELFQIVRSRSSEGVVTSDFAGISASWNIFGVLVYLVQQIIHYPG